MHGRIKELDHKVENLVVAIENTLEIAAVLAKKLAQRTSEEWRFLQAIAPDDAS